MRKIISIIFSFFLILLGISFSILNAEKVAVNFYIKTVHWPLSLVLILTLSLGVCIGFFVSLIKIFGLKRQNKKLLKRKDMAEKEVSNLRSMPIKDMP